LIGELEELLNSFKKNSEMIKTFLSDFSFYGLSSRTMREFEPKFKYIKLDDKINNSFYYKFDDVSVIIVKFLKNKKGYILNRLNKLQLDERIFLEIEKNEDSISIIKDKNGLEVNAWITYFMDFSKEIPSDFLRIKGKSLLRNLEGNMFDFTITPDSIKMKNEYIPISIS